MPSYNLAFTPANHREEFVAYAVKISQTIKPETYMLNETNSIPHVTLCHFDAEEKELPAIWEHANRIQKKSIELTFATRRNKIYDHPRWGGVCWLSLMPDKLDELKEIHLELAQWVKPTNAAFENYDPHLTLLNTLDEQGAEQIHCSPAVSPALKQRFNLVLGESDSSGQLVKLLF